MATSAPHDPGKPVKPSEYRPELDVLRAFAFLAVFVSHWVPDELRYYTERGFPMKIARPMVAVSQSGGIGVMLFFSLSSYLITRLLLRELEKNGRIDVRAFYMRRILRIWPLYLAFTIFATILPIFDKHEVFGLKALLAFVFFSGNWLWAFHVPLHTVALPLWSISVEEQFYLCWPWIVRRSNAERLKKTALGLIVLGFLNRVLVVTGVFGVDLWHNTFTQLDAIALGALLALGLADRLAAFKASQLARLLLIAGSVLAIFLAQFIRGEDDHDLKNLLFYPFVSVCCAAILFAVLGAKFDPKTPLARLFVYLGKISFGLYVVHYAAFYAVDHGIQSLPFKLKPIVSFGVRGLVAMALSLLVASASYRWLEMPFLRLKDRFGRS